MLLYVNCIWFKPLDCGGTWSLLDTHCSSSYIWFKPLNCGGTWSLLDTHYSSSYIKTALIAQDAATELAHKAATHTFITTHVARAINSECNQIETTRKEGEYLPSYAKRAYTKMKAYTDTVSSQLYFYYGFCENR